MYTVYDCCSFKLFNNNECLGIILVSTNYLFLKNETITYVHIHYFDRQQGIMPGPCSLNIFSRELLTRPISTTFGTKHPSVI